LPIAYAILFAYNRPIKNICSQLLTGKISFFGKHISDFKSIPKGKIYIKKTWQKPLQGDKFSSTIHTRQTVAGRGYTKKPHKNAEK